ncbi:MAG: SpoIIE family protein phosphatase [Brevinematia bacterium]
MTEALVGYVSFLVLQAITWFFVIKNPEVLKSTNTRLVVLIVLLASLMALFISVSWDTAKLQLFDITNISLRTTSALMVIANLLVFRLILTFPKEHNLLIVDIILAIIAVIPLYLLFSTNLIIAGVTSKEGILYRLEGKYYSLYSLIASLLLIVSTIIGIVRATKTQEKIYKLQIVTIVIGTSLSLLIAVVIAMIIPLVFKTFRFYYLSPLPSFILAGTLIFAVTRTKLLNISSGIYNTTVILIFTAIIGTLGGIVFNALSKQTTIPPDLLPVVALVSFLAILALSKYLEQYVREILKFKSHYLDILKKNISSIDLTKPEDEIVKNLVKAIKDNISSSKINIFIENEIGILENIFSENNVTKSLDKTDKALSILLSYKNKNIFFMSEILSDPILRRNEHTVGNMLRGLESEAIVLVKDGEHIIMILSLGEKENGSPYDDYDYNAINQIYTNLFTIGYILKNQRKQKSILVVNREIEMSKSIIETMISGVYKPSKNILDLEFITRSSSGLGGDFVDIIPLSKEKYMIIVGDISGKGITASMSMIVIKSSIRTLIRKKIKFKNIIAELNIIIKENLPKGTFFSGVFIVADISQNSIFFINNGIPVMWHYSSKTHSISQIQGEGKILGFVKDISKLIDVKKVSFEKGDIIAIATDGFTEATAIDGTKFNLSLVEKIIKQYNDKQSSEILTRIFDSWYEFSNRQIKDDVSLLVFKRP